MSEIHTINNVLRREVGDKIYFIGNLSSDIARKATYVPVAEDSKTYLDQRLENGKGYQRPGKISRMNMFKKYLKEYSNRLIPPVILSARGNWKFEPFDQSNEIGSLKVNGKAAIIDGQHRIGGIVSHHEDTGDVVSFDFICFENLTLEEEKKEFVTINGKQVGVSRSLQTYIGIDENENAALAYSLSTHDDSPFFEKITKTDMKPHHWFTLSSIEKNVKRIFNHGAFDELSTSDKLDVLIKYWSLIKDHNEIGWSDSKIEKRKDFKYKLLELTGNIAWSLIGPQILLKGFNPDDQSFDWSVISDVIQHVSEDFDWAKDGEFKGLTGEVGGKAIQRHLEAALSSFR